ncbi:MAG: hypothetical protein R2778_09500 [Saprospiraceae bacterium]
MAESRREEEKRSGTYLIMLIMALLSSFFQGVRYFAIKHAGY